MAAKVLETSSEGCQNIYYSIIKLLVQKLNSTAIAKKLKKYKKAFREYSKLRICECPAGAFGSCEDKEKVYVLKTEMKLNDSLEEFEKLQFEMNKVLGGKLLRLINVEEGCVQLTFRGFDEPELSLSKQNLQELRKIGVSGLSYYGDQVFDFSDSVPNPQQPAGITYVYVCSMHVYLYALFDYILYLWYNSGYVFQLSQELLQLKLTQPQVCFKVGTCEFLLYYAMLR